MPHPIEQRIVETRRKAARLSLIYGLSWVAGALVATIGILGLGDYWIRFHDPGIRALSTLAVLLVLGWTSFRYLYPAFARRLRDVEIARRIERRFPDLEDRLSSAVEFLRQDESDLHAGSAALRRAVIVETTADIERLNMDDVLERRPARRALAGAAGVLVLALVAVAFDPLAAQLAVARLIRPFGDDAWPRKHDLAFIKPPSRVAAGQTFEVELRDRNGPPPDEVRIHYRYENDGHPTEEVESMHLLDGVLVARKENVARPFKYRAEGGDDRSMDWIPLEVVEPPQDRFTASDALSAGLHRLARGTSRKQPQRNSWHTRGAGRQHDQAAQSRGGACHARAAVAVPGLGRRLWLRIAGRRGQSRLSSTNPGPTCSSSLMPKDWSAARKACTKFGPWPTSRRA